MQTVEFNVPASQANGTTVSPPVRDQYRVIAGSIVTQNTGIGNDWAIFAVLPNTQTGLLPAAAQGATFQLSNTQNPANVRITGFGVDGPPPNLVPEARATRPIRPSRPMSARSAPTPAARIPGRSAITPIPRAAIPAAQ